MSSVFDVNQMVTGNVTIGGDAVAFAPSNVTLVAGDVLVLGSYGSTGDIVTFSQASSPSIAGTLYATGDILAFQRSTTPVVPMTYLTIADIRAAFPGVLTKNDHLLSYAPLHPSLSNGTVTMGRFRGLTALTPSFDFTNLLGTGLTNCTCALSNSTIVFASSNVAVPTHSYATLSLASYALNKAYQGPANSNNIYFEVTSGSLPAGVTLSNNGVVTVDVGVVPSSSSTVTVAATNGWNN